MAKLALQHTERGQDALNEVHLSNFIPYTYHLDDDTIATKDGYLLQVVKLEGFPFETADQAELNQRKHIRNTLWRGLANSRFAVYQHIIRRQVDAYPTGDFSGFCKDLDDAWRGQLAQKRLFVNEQYLSVVRRPRRGAVGIIEAIGRIASSKTDNTAAAAERAANHKALNDAVNNILSTLASYGVRRLTVEKTPDGHHSEILGFLSYLINQEMRPVRLPRLALDQYLPYKRPFFGNESLEIRGAAKEDVTFGAMVSIKEYGPESAPGMMDALLRLPLEFVLTQSFAFIDQQKALDSLEQVQRVMDSAEDRAVSLREELSLATDATASGQIAFGEHHLTVMVKAKAGHTLDQAVAEVSTELTNLGLIAVREDLNQEAAFWAQLPGNFAYIARRALISSANFAGFASFHNFPQGKVENNHWGPAVTCLETTSGTPYAFNFHHGDLGNFTVIGPSGTGKTVVLTFLMAQAQRFKPRSVFFDKDRGAEIFIRAIGGQYSVIRPGTATGFNPLKLPDTAVNRAFLRDWLGQLVKPLDGSALNSTDRGIIADAVDANYQTPLEHRRLSVIQELFRGHERPTSDSIDTRLAPWWGAGERAWLFDNADDELHFDNRSTGFDLTFILDDAIGRTPTLLYLFHRVNDILSGEKAILFIDEGWHALDDPAFEGRIKDWLKTIRKKNGLIGFGSQSAKDAINSRIGDSIIEQSPTQIFMPNLRAEREAYCCGFGLSNEEFRIVRELPDTSRCFLIKHGAHSVIARLDLSGLDDLLSILSGREETVALLDQIRMEVGDDPADWLPVFYERRTK